MKIVAIGEATSNRPSPATILHMAIRRWQAHIAHFRDPYRPERHYMRGPGPKWREKHGLSASTSQ